MVVFIDSISWWWEVKSESVGWLRAVIDDGVARGGGRGRGLRMRGHGQQVNLRFVRRRVFCRDVFPGLRGNRQIPSQSVW